MTLAALDEPIAAGEPVMVGMDDEIEAELLHRPVAEGDHVVELPGGVHMEQRERRLGRPERFPRQMQQDGGVLTDGIEQHGVTELRRRLAEDMDALGFEELQMRGERGHAAFSFSFPVSLTCNPHSFFSSFSHHQRPARGSSPGWTARVHGAQPMETKPRACSGFTGMLLAAM